MRDHLTETSPFCWVIAACYQLFDRGRLAGALHCTEFQAFFLPMKLFQWRNNMAVWQEHRKAVEAALTFVTKNSKKISSIVQFFVFVVRTLHITNICLLVAE